MQAQDLLDGEEWDMVEAGTVQGMAQQVDPAHMRELDFQVACTPPPCNVPILADAVWLHFEKNSMHEIDHTVAHVSLSGHWHCRQAQCCITQLSQLVWQANVLQLTACCG